MKNKRLKLDAAVDTGHTEPKLKIVEERKTLTESAPLDLVASTEEPALKQTVAEEGEAATNEVRSAAEETKSEENKNDLGAETGVNSCVDAVKEQTLLTTMKEILVHNKDLRTWLWGLRAPLFLLLCIAIAPKLVLLWIFIIIAKPISIWIFDRLPEQLRQKLKRSLPKSIRNSAFLNDLGEGANQGLPFILFWLYLCCAPFALLWMIAHWILSISKSKTQPPKSENTFIFTQTKKQNNLHTESNFFYSQAFGIVFLAFFALGIPAFFSYSVYENLGIEKLSESQQYNEPEMRHASLMPKAKIPKVGLASKSEPILLEGQKTTASPMGAAATAVYGYNGFWPWIGNFGAEPTKASIFFVHFYLVSLAFAISVLFFRAWFLFPLNFLSNEHDIVLTESGIRRNSLKSWFLSVITINGWASGGGPDSLKWSQIKSLRFAEDGFFNLSPLPEIAFKKESLSYKLLNKMATFIDGIGRSSNPGNFLVFSTTEKGGDCGNNIRISLNGINREQRVRLYYAVKQWAPQAIIQNTVEEHLVGSTVLKDVRYTQLWFDMLTSKPTSKRQNVLAAGDVLNAGQFKIDDRLSTGGQATTYLATNSSGQKCVLKEFILATSSDSGALVESAREFEAEVSMLSQLNHPGIVRLDHFFSEEGRVYVVLEYIQGQSLRQKVLQEGPLSEAEVSKIGQSICEILEYLHGFNPPIVHRDITPENILIQPDGSVKLIDFSLAMRKDGRQPTESCGKQAFTPPEQFQEEVCVQSDLYSLGATMYYLLTGVVPKPISISSPAKKIPTVSSEMNAIVERATQLDLEKRYESSPWLKMALANLRAREETLTSESELV